MPNAVLTFKTVIYIACLMGIVSTFVENTTPDNGLKRQLKVLMGLMTLAAVLTPFMAKGFKLDLDSIDITAETRSLTAEIENDSLEMILNDAEKQYEEYFTNKLNMNEIKATVDIKMTVSNSGEISVESVTVTGDNIDRRRAAELINEELTETSVIFEGVQENELEIW